MTTIGHVPALRRFVFIDGQDFTDIFTTTATRLPVGSTVALELRESPESTDDTYGLWPCTETVDGWVPFIEAADHAGIPHGSWARLWATYPDGGRFCWIAGPVERNRR
jgi:hypothetical protein